MAPDQRTQRPGFGTAGQWAFVILMGLLTALFVYLGLWQVSRLGEKQAEIATAEARINEPARALPASDQWASLDPAQWDYYPVEVTGRFDHDQTVVIFGNLTDANGPFSGIGYWIMAPLQTGDGGVVWVNRGFVPQDIVGQYEDGGPGASGDPITLEAIARRPERSGPFTPEADIAGRREWIRNPERLALFLADADRPVLPVTLDAIASGPDGLPQGGETELRFSNRHLEYAGTWFAFALITPVMLVFWLARQRRRDGRVARGQADD
ncbi:SURF1 family protein [Pelagibacterium montanilacus]|uniref:SURF1 family protein n=1 Tax=Pelagibacterium montanilacus TaxID=2185280 RepID=UPI000F8E2FEB|nr:SURF1 family protein [Pelagibacterium montanilacus]